MDQLAGTRADDHAADHDAGAGAAEQLHEAVVDSLHLGAGVARERQRDRLGVDLSGVDGLLRDKTRKPGRAPLSAKVGAKVMDLTCSEPPGHARRNAPRRRGTRRLSRGCDGPKSSPS